MSNSAVPVAFVIDTLARGGAERVAVALANSLDVRRYRPYFITTRAPGDLAPELVPHVQQFSLGRRSRWDLGAICRLALLLDENHIQIVHSHNHTSSYFVRAARILARRAWLHVMHDHHGPVESSRWLPILDRLLVRRVDHYFAVSEALLAYATRRVGIPSSRCQYLLNGVVPPSDLSRQPPSLFTIVQVGRLAPDKNQLLAIEIAARLRQRLPDFRWLLVGRCDKDSAAYAEQCRQAIARKQLEQQVSLVGEQSDVSHYLRQANVGVLTSIHEGLPIALLEYMAWGLPIVVPDVGACRSVAGPSPGGFIATAEQPESFVSALLELAQCAERGERWGHQNHLRVQSEYSVATMTSQVMATYDQLLEAAAA